MSWAKVPGDCFGEAVNCVPLKVIETSSSGRRFEDVQVPVPPGPLELALGDLIRWGVSPEWSPNWDSTSPSLRKTLFVQVGPLGIGQGHRI